MEEINHRLPAINWKTASSPKIQEVAGEISDPEILDKFLNHALKMKEKYIRESEETLDRCPDLESYRRKQFFIEGLKEDRRVIKDLIQTFSEVGLVPVKNQVGQTSTSQNKSENKATTSTNGNRALSNTEIKILVIFANQFLTDGKLSEEGTVLVPPEHYETAPNKRISIALREELADIFNIGSGTVYNYIKKYTKKDNQLFILEINNSAR